MLRASARQTCTDAEGQWSSASIARVERPRSIAHDPLAGSSDQVAFILKEVRIMEKGRLKQTALVVLSIGSLVVGALGIADVGFFASNNGLGLLQILLGVGGLIIAVR